MIKRTALMMGLTPALGIFIAGVAFFFTLIGVFGLAVAVVSLIVFVTLACLTFRRNQDRELP